MGRRMLIGVSSLMSLLLASSILAAPTHTGTKGLLEVLSADNPGAGNFQFSLHLGGVSQDREQQFPFELAPGDTDTTWVTAWDAYYGVDFTFGIGYAFTDYLSVNYGGIVMMDAIETDNPPGRPETVPDALQGWAGTVNRSSIGLGDMEVGLKFTPTELIEELSTSPPKALEYFDLALYPIVSINTGAEWESGLRDASNFGKESQRNNGGIFRYFTTGGVDYGGLALLTLRTKTEVPFRLYLNGGYLKHTKMTGSIDADELVYGVGAEVGFVYFQPLVEFTGSARRGDIFGPDAYYISPALRFATPFGLNIDLGMAFRLSEDNDLPFPPPDTLEAYGYQVTTGWGAAPPWYLTFGLSYSYDFTRPPPVPPKGVIAGKVYDEETGEPLGATITFPGQAIASITSDPATGMYELTISPGDLRIHVEKEGYRWKEAPAIVKKDEKTLLDFPLKKKEVAKGYITGTITDRSTGEPLGATISFPQTQLTSVSSDLQTGIYKAALPPGTYVASISAEGYIAQSRPIVVNKDVTTKQDFALLKRGAKITLRGINFETGKANIRPDSYPVLDEAVRLLRENPRVRVEVQGHTDSVGSDSYNQTLSGKRARSVLDYLVRKGIKRGRLSARGYGESMPMAPNTTSEGRAKNRRIEFLILGE